MYLSVHEPAGLGQPAPPRRAAPRPPPPFSSGGDHVDGSDGERLLRLLTGRSPYQGYIQPIMAARGSTLPRKLLRIVTSPSAVPDPRLRGRFARAGGDGKIVGGTIDRRNGVVYMHSVPGPQGRSRVEYALHELVHLFAHPFTDVVADDEFERRYGKPCVSGDTDVGTFQRLFCAGLGEGATQVITEAILKGQGLPLYDHDRPYDGFTPPARKLIDIFSLDRVARAYFRGEVGELAAAMQSRWGDAWRYVANLASGGDPKRTLALIDRLEKAHWERLRRRSPPGDYPTLPTTTKLGDARGTMYVHIDGLGQPTYTPPTPQAPMPNPGLVTPPAPTTLTIAVLRSRLQCSAAQRAAIAAALGPGAVVTPDSIALAVQQAHNNLWLDLTDPDGPPRRDILVAAPSPTTVSLFTQAFGAAPTALPWRGARRNLGWVVATRLGGARRTMFSSSIRISCWGWPFPGGGVDRPMDYMVKALPGRECIALGALFWRAVAKSDRVSMASAILAAGLVIRYGVSYRMLAAPLSNLHCYVKYALSMVGQPVPQWVSDKCPQAT
jgi:hypothetical protein